MEKNKGELRPIAIDYLYDGMEVTEDIYNYDGKIMLLGQGNIITESKILQLKNFNNFNRNISVYMNTHRNMLQHGKGSQLFTQNQLEEEIGYSEIKDSMHNFLDETAKKDSISKEHSDIIADKMAFTLGNVDPSLIFQCVNASKPIDEYLRRHSINVGFLNGLVGKWMGMSEEKIRNLTIAGLLHDMGKTKIPTEILDLPDKLNISEFEIMKMHTIYSYELIEGDSRFTDDIKFAARHHHEKMNGSGYPDGIIGDQISFFARITAVSDIYDAMVSKRSYKEANNPFTIIDQLSNKKFSELDMKIVKVFTEHMPNELIGKDVLLSDGSIGVIQFIIPNDLEHPIVKVNGNIKKTNSELTCLRMVLD